MAVSRESTDPLWVQALRALEEDIRGGRFGPGRHLPAERVLGDRLQVSRITLRRALQELAAQGLIEPSPGRGWQVSERRVGEPPNALMSFSALGAARGLHATARILRRDLRQATLDESETLRVAPGSEVLDLERLRFLDGVPIAVHSAILPTARAGTLAEVDFTTASLFTALEERGVIPARADSTAQAEAADDRHAALLELAVGQPLMVVAEVLYDEQEQPIEVGRLAYRGDRYRLETTFVRG